MAMILIEEKEITENGVVFIEETSRSDKTGKESVVKYPKPADKTAEAVTPPFSQLDHIEAVTEYLMAMQE